jgi:hypothetical protein
MRMVVKEKLCAKRGSKKPHLSKPGATLTTEAPSRLAHSIPFVARPFATQQFKLPDNPPGGNVIAFSLATFVEEEYHRSYPNYILSSSTPIIY